jgi:hypothetical protein
MTATTITSRLPRAFSLGDPATYRRTAHLLLDLPRGVALFSVAVSFVATSAAAALTVVGMPLLVITLVGARWVGRLERARARTFLRLSLPEPDLAPRGWRRLTDATAWRAVAYAILMLPVGIATATTALVGWAVGAAMLTFPAYAPFLDESSFEVGSHTFAGPGAWAGTSVCGVVVLLMMPAVLRGLAGVDAVMARRLLR